MPSPNDAPETTDSPPPLAPLSGAEKFRVVARVVLFLVVAAVAAAIILAPGGQPLAVGQKAPAMVAKSFNGKNWRLSDHYGKPLLVNFWGTWCAPCVREMPLFSKVAKKTRGKVEFVGIAVDSPADDVAAMVKRLDIQYAIATVDHSTQRQWKADFLPTTYLLDANGNVVWNAAGMVNEKTLKAAFKTHAGVTW
jgi:thiol-disulfide isomerase/thioredoxin